MKTPTFDKYIDDSIAGNATIMLIGRAVRALLADIDVDRAKQSSPTDILCCFCTKWRKDVNYLVRGPGGHCICDECIGTCAEIIATAKSQKDQPSTSKPQDPP